MKQLFESRLFQGLSKVADCLIVSFLWLICCIPLVTIGASTTAMYYTIHKSIIGDRDYVTHCFFSSFKDNFKQSVVCTLVWLVVMVVLIFDASFVYKMVIAGESSSYLFYFFVVAIFYALGWGCYMFPYMARFSNTTKNTLLTAILLEMKHFPTTLVLLVMLALAVFLFLFSALFLIFLPAVLFIGFDYFLERVFRKYMSEERDL